MAEEERIILNLDPYCGIDGFNNTLCNLITSGWQFIYHDSWLDLDEGLHYFTLRREHIEVVFDIPHWVLQEKSTKWCCEGYIQSRTVDSYSLEELLSASLRKTKKINWKREQPIKNNVLDFNDYLNKIQTKLERTKLHA